ncbi:MAG: carbon storage regulator [Oscillospiraceae bacterium]|nr:carbon storage regulator [Oscillospiraceae bacterium]
MLVITRKLNESIIVQAGETKIEIAVLDLAKDKAKIGVNAPREVKIIRKELIIAEASNVEASKAVSKEALDALLKNTKK